MSLASMASSQHPGISVRKPSALGLGASVAGFAPASPGDDAPAMRGYAELERLGFVVNPAASQSSDGYFAASAAERRADLLQKLLDPQVDGLIALRGGYGSNYLLDEQLAAKLGSPKCLIGFSDVTSLQIFLWQKCGWTSIYGPMLAAGLEAGAGAPKGYDEPSFLAAIRNVDGTWQVPLLGELLARGQAEGTILGGCLTLLETAIGTPWELDTRNSILLLEDRGMKPWQVDRALMHLTQAGKFADVRGIVLGDFPDCPAPVAGSPTVRDVCDRILKPLGIPIVFGAPVGHTIRPMLTIPLGVPARLRADGAGSLEFLEAAVTS